MLKKLSLYFLLFLVVCSCTGVAVVTLYSDSTSSTLSPSAVVEENPNQAAFAKIVSNSMTQENFSGDFAFFSDNLKNSLSGNFVVVNDSKGLKFKLNVAGEIEDFKIQASVVFLDGWIYVKFGELFYKVNSDDILTTVNSVFNKIGAELISDFNLDQILTQIEDLIIEQTETGYKFSIDLPVLNKVFIETNADYIPSKVEANDIVIKNLGYSFVASASAGNAGFVSLSQQEKEKYIDISDAFGLVDSVLGTVSSLPVCAQGEIKFLNEKIAVEAFVDKNFNVEAHVSFNNISAKVFLIGNDVFLDICGTQIKTDLRGLYVFLSKKFGPEIVGVLSSVRFVDDSVLVGEGAKVSIVSDENMISQIVFELGQASGELNFFPVFDAVVSAPSFSSPLLLSDVERIVEQYLPVLSLKNEMSFSLAGAFGSTTFDLTGYANFSDIDNPQFFVGNKINNLSVFLWFKDNYAYLMSGAIKAKFSSNFVSNMFDFALDYFNFSIPSTQQIVELASTQIISVEISKAGIVSVEFVGGEKIVVSSPKPEIFSVEVSNFVVEGQVLNLKLTTLKVAKSNLPFMSSVNLDSFTDMSEYGGLTQSAVNTFTNANTEFSGKISVDIFGINIKNIDIKLVSKFVNNKLEIVLTLDNLPVLSSITKLNAITYKKQTTTLTFKDGKLGIVRNATRRNGKVVEQANKTIMISELSVDHISDVFGFDDYIIKKIKSIDIGSVKNLFSLDMLSLADNNLSLSIETSKIAKYVSDSSVSIAHDGSKITSINFSIKLAKIVSISCSIKNTQS